MDEPNRSTGAVKDSLVGRCEHCGWSVTAGSHSEVVRVYQDHLRERHPAAWLRA